MDDLTWNITIVIILTIVIFCLLKWSRKRKYNLPPGPYPFPIIGSVIQVARIDSKKPMAAIQVLGRKYGPVVGLQMGSVYAVGINGFDAVKELQSNPDFMNRSNDKYLIDKSLGLPLGLGWSEAKFWSKNRTTFHRLIREYGFGKNEQMYHAIIDESKDFIDVWKNQCSRNPNACTKIHIKNQFQVVILSIVWALGTGERFQGRDDPKLRRLSYLTNKYMATSQVGNGMVGLFPKLMYMFPKLTGYSKALKYSQELYQFFDEIIQERIELGYYPTSQLNLIDSFLKLIHDNNPAGLGPEPKTDILENVYTRENLITVLEDFSVAGNDSTANSLNFLIRYIVQNPKVQKKLHEEIDRVVGHNRLVIMEDKSKLLYVQAVIFEGLRITGIAPTVPRKVFKDSKFRGYDIPQGTIILPNYYGSNRDELIWENPEAFIPERFLDSSQTVLINTEKILTFGIGKRNCIGESVAKASLFLIFTSLLQQFFFQVDPDHGVPSSNTLEFFTRDTEPYNIIIRQKY